VEDNMFVAGRRHLAALRHSSTCTADLLYSFVFHFLIRYGMVQLSHVTFSLAAPAYSCLFCHAQRRVFALSFSFDALFALAALLLQHLPQACARLRLPPLRHLEGVALPSALPATLLDGILHRR